MNRKIASFFTLLLTVMFLTASAASAKPVPKDIRFLLGMYYGNGSVFLVRENRGALEIVYPAAPENKDFGASNIFHLVKEHFDSYTLYENGPVLSAEAPVHFERDTDGNGVVCKIGGKRFNRNFYPGEGTKILRLEKNADYVTLKSKAPLAVMPAKLQQGQAARLVPLKQAVPGVKFALYYAGQNNIFGVPLYDETEAFLDEEAALALKRVSDRLAGQGFGLLVWEGYRPWYVSKLASDLLPRDKKPMLPLPDKGEDRNTGRTVDVGLYETGTGEAVSMISDFDEVSVRQYPAYPGGTEQQRRLREMLVNAMTAEGFVQGKEEWWHFTYGDTGGWQHLNIPYGQIR